MNPVSITMGRDRDVKAVSIQTKPTPILTQTSELTTTPTQIPSSEPTTHALFENPLEILGLMGVGALIAVVCVVFYLRRGKNKNRSYEIDKDDGTVAFGDGEKRLGFALVHLN